MSTWNSRQITDGGEEKVDAGAGVAVGTASAAQAAGSSSVLPGPKISFLIPLFLMLALCLASATSGKFLSGTGSQDAAAGEEASASQSQANEVIGPSKVDTNVPTFTPKLFGEGTITASPEEKKGDGGSGGGKGGDDSSSRGGGGASQGMKVDRSILMVCTMALCALTASTLMSSGF